MALSTILWFSHSDCLWFSCLLLWRMVDLPGLIFDHCSRQLPTGSPSSSSQTHRTWNTTTQPFVGKTGSWKACALKPHLCHKSIASSLWAAKEAAEFFGSQSQFWIFHPYCKSLFSFHFSFGANQVYNLRPCTYLIYHKNRCIIYKKYM